MSLIKKVAVLGAGVMGSTIAAQLANAGCAVLLLDVIPVSLSDDEKGRGWTLDSPQVRKRLSQVGLEKALKAKPAAFYLPRYASLIQTGNFEDDINKLRDCDWVIEVIVENMEAKRKLFSEKVAPNLHPLTLVSTNTSGLSVAAIAQSLPLEARKRFLGTHFFNPPRYMRLMELIPGPDTDADVLLTMATFISRRLGKGIVYAKDTPNFIANRIGVFALFNSIMHMLEMGLTVEEVDSVAGPATARARSATFRTADLVGLDTLIDVAMNSYENLPDDEARAIYQPPAFLVSMVEKNLLGTKSEGGFYRKKRAEGKSEILYFDYHESRYKALVRPEFPSIQAAKVVDNPSARLKGVVLAKDKGAEFAWRTLRDTIIYAFNRIPEVADTPLHVDNAMRWGFGWELGPFEMLDAIGIEYFVERAQSDGMGIPEELEKVEAFYRYDEGKKLYYDIQGGRWRDIPSPDGQINFEILKRSGGTVERNAGASLLDVGDGVFCLEFHSKMNAIGADAVSMSGRAVTRAEQEGVGLVVGNTGQNFSVGANLLLIAVTIAAGEFDEIEVMVRRFQNATMGLKYAPIPVVVAPFGMTLGGGCEVALHGDAINAFAETYMGLVEIGVGLLPAGGGTKEMALRAIELSEKYATDVSPFIFKFMTNIATAKVSTGAVELFELGYLRDGDAVTMNLDSLITDAKQKVLALARNYRPMKPREDIKIPGRSVAASIKSQLWNLEKGNYATKYDTEVGGIIADVITGGDAPGGMLVSEQHLLDLERDAFLTLCGKKNTVDRIQHMLKKGKPLRN